MQDIDETLKKIVQRQLSPATIVDQKSEEDEDEDGDPILRIRVVYEAEQNHLDPMKVASLVWYLREPLSSLPVGRFPILSFMIPKKVEDAIR
ncbi:MAG: hypothetical protein F4203_03600 [Rhodobacteraceae bacterium]|nr:hypothetical protein [Paracoccaceae bacterium]